MHLQFLALLWQNFSKQHRNQTSQKRWKIFAKCSAKIEWQVHWTSSLGQQAQVKPRRQIRRKSMWTLWTLAFLPVFLQQWPFCSRVCQWFGWLWWLFGHCFSSGILVASVLLHRLHSLHVSARCGKRYCAAFRTVWEIWNTIQGAMCGTRLWFVLFPVRQSLGPRTWEFNGQQNSSF